MLVNDLTVSDARHLLATEGGPLEVCQLFVRGISIGVVAAACAYAIWAGHATVWHLALPMVGEYFVLLLAMPAMYLAIRHPAMRKDAVGSVRLLVLLAIAGTLLITARSYQADRPWAAQLTYDVKLSWTWIRDHKIHWAIAAAMAGMLLELPGRLANFKRFGPPFSPVGLGCGMRVAVLVLACFLLPVVMSGTATRNAWILLGLLVLAEVLTLVMHLDIQRRLAKLDSK
ncbi:MAG: hypothetical protein AB7G28_05835 [Pirellulales bacterium]